MLKSYQHFRKITEAIYIEVSEKTEAARKQDRRVSVSGMLNYLGVSRSGYRSWLKHTPTDTEKRREYIKAKIQDIHDESKQNYRTPQITRKLRQNGEIIPERRTYCWEIYEGNGDQGQMGETVDDHYHRFRFQQRTSKYPE